MTKDVLLSLVGTQLVDGQNDNIELVTVANYYKRNGHHYVVYDEYMDDTEETVKNTIRFDDTFFEMTKRGGMKAQLLFYPNETHLSVYVTPAGPLNIETTTREYNYHVEEDLMEIYIRYTLEINCAYCSENEIYIKVESK